MMHSDSLISTITRHTVLALSALIVIFPFLWIVAAGFKTQIDLLLGKFLFVPTWRNFESVL
ncbi:MAG: hypothetical protein Q8S27_15140, partial [Hoeflea sp.]|nr:hypothetical protein [Hoeflea sp.]